MGTLLNQSKDFRKKYEKVNEEYYNNVIEKNGDIAIVCCENINNVAQSLSEVIGVVI